MLSSVSTFRQFLALPALIVLAGIGLSQPGPASRKFELTQADLDALVQKANKTIQEQFTKDTPDLMELRSQALLIALAAQNRMSGHKDDRLRLATLRDSAVKLARSLPAHVAISTVQFNEARKHAAVLAQFPKLKIDPKAMNEIIRLKGTFDQEDIDLHFSNWAGGNRIERQLIALIRQKTPLSAEQMTDAIPPLAFKVALLAEMLRDFDDHVRPNKVAQRKEWVALATEVQYTGWELAEVARTKNAVATRKVIVSLNNACTNCHSKFRE